MNCLSLIYFVNWPLHVSGIFIAHHQEVFIVYVQELVRVTRLGDLQLVRSGQVRSGRVILTQPAASHLNV
jgi:hypothetical protein